MYSKIDSINEIVRESVSLKIRDLMPDTFFSITKVDTSRDLSYCDLSITAVNNEDILVKELRKRVPEIKKHMAQKTSLRKIPHLRFHIDSGLKRADKIDELLHQIKK